MKSIITFILSAFLLVIFSQAFSMPALDTEMQKQMVMTNLSSNPLAFTQNRGQWNEKALFRADACGATYWFCSDEVAMVFTRDTNELEEDGMPKMPEGMPDKFNHLRYKKEWMALHARFIGANQNAQIIPEDKLGYN